MNKNLLMISGDKSFAEGKHGAFYNTLEEFHKHWNRIDIICPKVGPKEIQEVFGNVFIHSSPWPLILQPFWIFKKGQEIYHRNKFDLVTCHDYPPFYNGLGAFLLWRRIRIPYVLEIHHIPGYPKSANFKEWLYRLFARLFIALDALPARAVRVVNKYQTKEFLVRAGVPVSKIMYIPSIYINHDIFQPRSEPKEYDLIFVGRLAENKGIELFLEVAKTLNLKTLIVGDGPLRTFCKLKIENCRKDLPKGEKLKIDMHGWAKDSQEVADFLNKSKLFVLTSYNEGGPRVVAEAMACGVPVLATPVGIIPDIKSACTIIDWNVDDIVKKARNLLSDEQVYKSKIELGLEVVKQFNKESAIKNYAEKIKQLI